VVQNQVDARPRHEHRHPSQELDRVEHHVRRPIDPPMPEPQHHLPVAGHANAVSRHRRPQGVAAHALKLLAVPRRHDEARMQIEAVRPRVTASRRGRLDRLGRIAQMRRRAPR
jgi:hypothetical protein